MLDIIITIILTSAFFILFFKPYIVTKNKRKEEVEEPQTAQGFIEDSGGDPFVDKFIPPRSGLDVPAQDFAGYSGISEYNWLHGFPHKKA